MDQRDFRTATLALSSGYSACLSCWEDGVTLARLYEQTGHYAASEDIFQILLTHTPAVRATVALAQHDALLLSQRYTSLIDLSWREIAGTDSAAAAWIVPLVLATAAENTSTHAPSNPGRLRQLPLGARTLLILAAPPPEMSAAELRARALAARLDSPGESQLRWRLLLQRSDRQAALSADLQDQDSLGVFETALARWAAIALETAADQVAMLWEELIPVQPSSLQVERLSATALLTNRHVPLASLRLGISPTDKSSVAALWVLASFQGQENLADQLLGDLGYDPEEPFRGFPAGKLRERLKIIAMLLPIPRQVHYALIPIGPRDHAPRRPAYLNR
ncbi:MAG: hypothetical protein J6386_17785 [Candidatus Synoicihabitans palmerolidicus]|nr:hypothetical protein [Candidatus Synoicihabitans palmerolidicus]